jgi:hypothetical protein
LSEKERLEKLRQAEEERQKQEALRLQTRQEKEGELKRKIEEAIEQNQANIQNTAPITTPEPATSELSKKEAEQLRALELERIRRENEEAEAERAKQIVSKNRSTINEIKESSDNLIPLRTLKGDLETALRSNEITDDDLARVNKKIFPWAK